MNTAAQMTDRELADLRAEQINALIRETGRLESLLARRDEDVRHLRYEARRLRELAAANDNGGPLCKSCELLTGREDA